MALLLAAIAAACADSGDAHQGIYIQQSWQVTRTVSGHRAHVLRRGIACSSCHEIGKSELGEVEPSRCAACHEKEARIEHAASQAAHEFGEGAKADCRSCHAFTLDGSGHEARPQDCKRCHASAQGQIPAVSVHGTENCLSCHRPHEAGPPASAPCADCHKDVSSTHPAHGKNPTEACQTCHQHQHATAISARASCQDCHSKHSPIVPPSALFEGGHTECLGCHRPHATPGQAIADCRSCHEDQTVLGGARVPAHNQCTSCHAPHGVKNGAEQACARCHSNVHPDHPQRAGSGCIECHDPHPRAAHAGSARACSTCHQFASSDHASHAGTECTKCHKPHDFGIELAKTSVCSDCHAQRVAQVTHNPGHQACDSCHRGLPHRPEALRVGCESCHAKEQGMALAQHSTCTNCHEPHSGSVTSECRSCHKQEHATAPSGHTNCTSCHEPHGGKHELKSCPDCHAAEAASAHGHAAQGCLGCHRPHGPDGMAKPPACKTCHQVQALPGLHQESKHQACERCHTGHGDTAGLAREVCLTCHQDRAKHFPDAPRCANCHLFTPNH